MIRIVCVLSLLLLLTCCRNVSSSNGETAVTDKSITAVDARYYIDNDIYIGAEICYDIKNPENSPVSDSMSEQDKAKWCAAIYRYFSATELNDGKYRCKAENGGELKMSEKVFEMLTENLKELNQALETQRAQWLPGPEITPVSEEYLRMMYEFNGMDE